MIDYIITKLEGVLDRYHQWSIEEREVADNALRSISNALTETRLYYRDIEEGIPKNKDRERQLVLLWSAAAIPVRHIDPELASICQDKSDYWLNPENWDDQRIIETGISLENVNNRFKKLLKKTRRK